MSTPLGSAHGKVTIDTSGAETGVRGISSTLSDLAHVGQFLGVSLTDVFSKITSGVSSVASSMIQGNAQFENYESQFTVLLGSTELAQERLADLAKFGAETPFELPQVVNADKILQAFGLHALDAKDKFGFSGEEILRIAGDTASGAGVSIEQISTYIGKFAAGSTGEAISRMQELGIVTRAELADMGLEFSKSGQLLSPLPEATDVLLTAMNEKYGGLMEIQSSTFTGMMSNLSDWKAGVLRQVGEPLFEAVKEQLSSLLSFLQSDAVKAGIATLTDKLATGISTAVSWIVDKLIPGVKRLIQIFQGGGFTALFTAFEDGSSYISSFLTSLGVSEGVAESVGLAFHYLWTTLSGVYNAVLLLITGDFKGGIFGLMEDDSRVDFLFTLRDTLISLGTTAQTFITETLIPALVQFGNWFMENKETILQVIMGITVAFGAFSIISTVVGWITGFIATISAVSAAFATAGTAGAAIVAFLGGPLTIAIAVIAGLVGLFAAAWSGNWFGIRDTLTEVWETKLLPALTQLKDFLSFWLPIAIETLRAWWVDIAWPAIVNALTLAWSFISPILNSIWAFITLTLIPAIQNLWTQWVTVIWPAITLALETAWSLISPILNGIVTFITTTLIPTVTGLYDEWVTRVWPAIQSITESVMVILTTIFTEIARWINDNIVPAVTLLYDTWVTDVWPEIQKVLESVWAIIQPVFSEINTFLRVTLVSALVSLKSSWDSNFNGLKSTADTVSQGVGAFFDRVEQFASWLSGKVFDFKFEIPDLPDWFTPHSPLPLHTAARNFYQDLQNMDFTPKLDFSDFQPLADTLLNGSGAGTPSTSSTSTYHSYQVQANYSNPQDPDTIAGDLRRLSYLT